MQQPKGSLISYMSNLAKQHGGINCAQGVPGFAPPQALITALQDSLSRASHQYAPSHGIPRLREQIASRYGIDAASIFITNGATEAISALYIMLKRRKTTPLSVGAFNPVYESYRHLPKVFGDLFVPFDMAASGDIDCDAFEEKIAASAIDIFFIDSPGNPRGVVFSEESIVAMTGICKKHDCILIVDAVYSDMWQSEPPYIPWDRISDHLFVVSSFSKMFSVTGWRVGWAAIPAQRGREFQDVHDYTGLSGVSVLQEGLSRFLEQRDEVDTYLELLRYNTKKSYDIMSKALVALECKPLPVQGGYFVWAELPKTISDDLHFALDLFEKEGVAVVPGRHFYPESTRFIRLNIARPAEEIEKAVARINRYFLSVAG